MKRPGGGRGGPRGERKVYVLPAGAQKPEPVTVKLGINDGIATEVLEGLKVGDPVVTGMTMTDTKPAQPSTNPLSGRRAAFLKMPAVIHLDAVSKIYRTRRCRAARRARPFRSKSSRANSSRSWVRAARVNHNDEHARLPRPPDQRPIPARRHRRFPARPQPARGHSESENRFHFPGLQPALAHFRFGKTVELPMLYAHLCR